MTTQTNNNSIDRNALQEAYVDRIIDGMDLKDLLCLVADMLNESFDNMSESELIAEVEEYYPDLLDSDTVEAKTDVS